MEGRVHSRIPLVIVGTYLLLRYLNVGNVKVVTVLCLQSLMITRTIIAVIADQKR